MTLTSTISPILKTSNGCLILCFDILEICTKPSFFKPISINAPKSTTFLTELLCIFQCSFKTLIVYHSQISIRHFYESRIIRNNASGNKDVFTMFFKDMPSGCFLPYQRNLHSQCRAAGHARCSGPRRFSGCRHLPCALWHRCPAAVLSW